MTTTSRSEARPMAIPTSTTASGATGDRPARPVAQPPGEGRAIWHLGALLHFKVTGDDTGGRCWVMEQLAAQGMAPPLHRHDREDEVWYVLEGEITYFVGDLTQRAAAGAVVYGPRGVPHTFRVETPLARFVVFTTPAGFERFFFETGQPAGALTLPPPGPPPDAGAARRLAEAGSAYGLEILGPPPGA